MKNRFSSTVIVLAIIGIFSIAGPASADTSKLIGSLVDTLGVTEDQATGGSGAPVEHWRKRGWNVIDSHSVSRTLDQYREYIEGSRGELSVAKNLYTATRSGWFSCRSVCYLAAGRPVVVQDTGFSEVIPTGEGLHAFVDEDSAVEALQGVESDYASHAAAASEVAREHFGHDRVLGDLLAKVGL